jgi:hypothetical protein
VETLTVEAGSAKTVSEVVLRAIATATKDDRLETISADGALSPQTPGPLYSVIDPDALDTLFRSPSGGTIQGDGEITFGDSGRQMTVHSHGLLEVRSRGATTTAVSE